MQIFGSGLHVAAVGKGAEGLQAGPTCTRSQRPPRQLLRGGHRLGGAKGKAVPRTEVEKLVTLGTNQDFWELQNRSPTSKFIEIALTSCRLRAAWTPHA